MTPGDHRPPNPPPRRPHPPTVPPRDTKSSLYEAAVAAVQERAAHARTRAAWAPRPRRRSRWVRFVGLMGVVGLGLLVLRPSWLAGPSALAPEPGAVAAASVRVVLIRERDLVRAYLQRTGRLPGTLRDAGSTARGVEYRRAGEGFLLSASAGDSLILLRNSDSMAAFLGQSLTRLKNRARYPR